MDKTRIRVDIMGRGFNLISGENTDYLARIAKEVDLKMRALKDENSKLTYETSAVLTALNLCDELVTLKSDMENNEKEKELSDENNRLRSELVEYSKELSKAENNLKRLERELEKIKKEYKDKEEALKQEYSAKEKEILDMLDSM